MRRSPVIHFPSISHLLAYLNVIDYPHILPSIPQPLMFSQLPFSWLLSKALELDERTPPIPQEEDAIRHAAPLRAGELTALDAERLGVQTHLALDVLFERI